MTDAAAAAAKELLFESFVALLCCGMVLCSAEMIPQNVKHGSAIHELILYSKG